MKQLVQLYTDYLESEPQENPNDLCLFGYAYKLQSLSGRQVLPLRTILKKLLRTNISVTARVNLVTDLGHLSRGDSEVPPLLCQQLPISDPFLRETSAAALAEAGVSSTMCGQVPPVYSAGHPDSLSHTEKGTGVPIPGTPLEENGKSTDKIVQASLRATLFNNRLMQLNFSCPADTRPYIGWFCYDCKGDELRSGSNFPPDAIDHHTIHAGEPGTYRINVTCNRAVQTGYAQSAGADFRVP